jgi:outer membrane protein assembly factor BamB
MCRLILILLISTLAPADWPQFHQNSANHANTNDTLALNRFSKHATANLHSSITAGPVVKGDTVYIGTHGGVFYALNAGKPDDIIWQYPPSGNIGIIRGAAAVAGSLIVVGSEDSTLYAFDYQGSTAWTFKTQEGIIANVNYNPALGHIYAGDLKGFLYCLNISGGLVWQFIDTNTTTKISPVLQGVASEDSFIAMHYGNKKMYYLQDNGNSCSVLWTWRSNHHYPTADPTIYKNHIYMSGHASEARVMGCASLLRADGTDGSGLPGRDHYVLYNGVAVHPGNDFIFTGCAWHRVCGYTYNNGSPERIPGWGGDFKFHDTCSFAGPAVSQNRVVFTLNTGEMKIYNHQGIEEFKDVFSSSNTGKVSFSAPAIARGNVYFGDPDGIFHCYGCEEGTTSVQESHGHSKTPLSLSLTPNPANPSINIEYSLPAQDIVEITLYNLSGQSIKILVKGKKEPGTHRIIWNNRNSQALPAGVYLLKLKSKKGILFKKITWLH